MYLKDCINKLDNTNPLAESNYFTEDWWRNK